MVNIGSSKDESEFLNFLKNHNFFDNIFTKEIHRKFTTYHQEILEHSEKINLISHNDLSKLWCRHILDSLIPLELFPNIFRHLSTGGETTSSPEESTNKSSLHSIKNLAGKNFIQEGGSSIRTSSLKQDFSARDDESAYNMSKNFFAVDIGSGAGFPAFPLKIVLTGSRFVLVDSDKKKCGFMNSLIEKMKLNETTVISERVENLGRDPEHRGKYDFGFTRAIAKIPAAIELLIPLIKPGGYAFFWVSGKNPDERSKIEEVCKLLGGRIYEIKEYFLPDAQGNVRDRRIIAIEKAENTDKRYPRRVGIPQKRPLV